MPARVAGVRGPFVAKLPAAKPQAAHSTKLRLNPHQRLSLKPTPAVEERRDVLSGGDGPPGHLEARPLRW